MVTTTSLYLAFLALLYAERGIELWLTVRNAHRSFAVGGSEVGRGHYPIMVALHAVFPLACGAEVLLLGRPFPGALGVVALCFALGAQGLRWWAIRSLGWRWNTRIIIVPGAKPIDRGPYLYLRHPNYLAVLVEAAAVPLIHGAWISAVVFPLANAAMLLGVRIPAEERALGPEYAALYAHRARLIPGGRRD